MAVGTGSRPAAGGGRWVEVAPERLERWLAGFAARHGEGGWQVSAAGDRVDVSAADGAAAAVTVPFPPLPAEGRPPGEPYAGLVAHACLPRRLGLVLARRGGYAVALAEGGTVLAAKVGSRHVQGRTAAGGWSQQRFARRREGQAREAAAAVADTVVRLLVPEASRLDAVVSGGDRAMLAAVLADPRLAVLRPLVCARVLDVPQPRRAGLDAAVGQARAVRIRVVEAGG